jgi:phosphoribosylamine--glycine ligase
VKVLVIGSGGREHAIAWKMSGSKHISEIYCSPGNAGIAEIAECVDFSPSDFRALIDFVKSEWIDLTIVCSEKFLARGIVNAFEREGCRILGPDRTASQIRSSRVFTKNLLRLHRLPTAEYKVFTSYLHAQDHIRLKGAPVVIKTGGYSEDGIFIASTVEEATDILKLIMKDRFFGDAGKQVIIEENLRGGRISFLALTDGKTITPLTSLYIHRSKLDNTTGPATAVAGAYSPVPFLKGGFEAYLLEKIMNPLLKAFNAEGIKYKGFISADLIVNKEKAHIFELDCCLGSLYAQAILPRLKTDLMDLVSAVTEERLSDTVITWRQKASVCIVVYSKGQPPDYQRDLREGLEKTKSMEDIVIFHEHSSFGDGDGFVPGSSIFSITSTGSDIEDAKTKAYNALEKIHFEGMYYSKDIGNILLSKEQI